MHETIAALKERLAALAPSAPSRGMFLLGEKGVDAWLGGGLARGALHEILAAREADMAAAAGLAATFALRAGAPADASRPVRHIAWVRQAFAETETGALHAPGLMELGIDPDALFLVRARGAVQALRAGHEAARCTALGCVVIEVWKNPKALDFTATRRLSLSAAKSGVTVFLLRRGPPPRASAALTRWSVATAPSAALEADAPGHPAFALELVRHRAGIPGRVFRLEWDRDDHVFRSPRPLSGAVVSFPADGPSVAAGGRIARAG
jgi:protein ImuA